LTQLALYQRISNLDNKLCSFEYPLFFLGRDSSLWGCGFKLVSMPYSDGIDLALLPDVLPD